MSARAVSRCSKTGGVCLGRSPRGDREARDGTLAQRGRGRRHRLGVPADELQAVSVHHIAPEETIELTVRRYTLRIVSDERPDERAESVPPRLEEAYIYLTGGNRDDAPEG